MKEKIWKTVMLGCCNISWNSYPDALEKHGFEIFALTGLIFKRMCIAKNKIQIALVRKRVADLDLSKGGTLKQIHPAAQELGLNFCPSEVGPALRLNYPDQPDGEKLIIAMWPIDINLGGLSEVLDVFTVENVKGHRYLSSFDVCNRRRDHIFRADDELVFSIPE
jgi:hypothetical protein